MEAISPKIPLFHGGSYGPQEPHLLQGTIKAIPKTSLVASLPPRFWYDISSSSWYTDGPHGRPIPLRQHGHHPGQLLPSNIFDHQLWAIDVALANKIKNSSSSDPLVLQAVHQMEKELLLFNRSTIKDWTFDDGQLYYKICLYVPEPACHDRLPPPTAPSRAAMVVIFTP